MKLDKKTLLTPNDKLETRMMVVTAPDGSEGEIEYRKIKTVKEFTSINEEIDRMHKLAGTLGEFDKHVLAGRTEDEITCALYASKCIVGDDYSMEEGLQLCDTIGPQVKVLVSKIMEFSGLSDKSLKEGQKKLEEDEFQTGDSAPEPEVSAPASE